jgi:hypothetical protein
MGGLREGIRSERSGTSKESISESLEPGGSKGEGEVSTWVTKEISGFKGEWGWGGIGGEDTGFRVGEGGVRKFMVRGTEASVEEVGSEKEELKRSDGTVPHKSVESMDDAEILFLGFHEEVGWAGAADRGDVATIGGDVVKPILERLAKDEERGTRVGLLRGVT